MSNFKIIPSSLRQSKNPKITCNTFYQIRSATAAYEFLIGKVFFCHPAFVDLIILGGGRMPEETANTELRFEEFHGTIEVG